MLPWLPCYRILPALPFLVQQYRSHPHRRHQDRRRQRQDRARAQQDPAYRGRLGRHRQQSSICDKKGNHYNKDRFTSSIWKPAIEALRLPSDLTPHSARHTCATRLAAAGARPEDIQQILGHADYAVTANTYINQDVSTLANSMEMMA